MHSTVPREFQECVANKDDWGYEIIKHACRCFLCRCFASRQFIHHLAAAAAAAAAARGFYSFTQNVKEPWVRISMSQQQQ